MCHTAFKKQSYSVQDATALSCQIRYSPELIGERPSTGSGADSILYIFDGVQRVPNVWWNDTDRNVNLNTLANTWNDNYWFVFVC